MKYLIFTALVILSISIKAQTLTLTANGFADSKDSTKNYVVIDMPGVNAADLYSKAATYYNKVYNNSPLSVKPVVGKSIVISAVTSKIKGDVNYYKYDLKYMINTEFKDGKVKFEPSIEYLIEDPNPSPRRKVYLRNTDSSAEGEISAVFMKSKKDGKYKVFNDELKASIDQWANSYISDLRKALADNW